MDLYTIARIFRSYPSKNNRPSVDYARNIIVFAGGGHINQYTPVLKELGFRLIKESINPRGCVDISKFKSPWFSKRISPKNTHTYFTYDEPDEREIIMSNYKSTKFKGKHKKFKIRSQKRTRKELAKNSQRSRQAKAFKN